MAEGQITVGRKTYPLPELFLVMATQNPIEQEGTYPLPEAQLDRFLMHLAIDYPDAASELEILKLNRGEALKHEKTKVEEITQADIFAAREQVLSIHMAPAIEQYIVDLIIATRSPEKIRRQTKTVVGLWRKPACDHCFRSLRPRSRLVTRS